MSILFDPELLKAGDKSSTHRQDSLAPKRIRKKAKHRRNDTAGKNRTGEQHQDLVLYGYRCQLFIDEAGRQDVEEGNLLIPWMGDKKLMIDRYDCRGSLYSKEEFDPSLSKTQYTMTPEEWQIEQYCDEERYRALNEDDAELAQLEEEEEKRSLVQNSGDNSYQEVGFSYNDSSEGTSVSLLQAYYDFHQSTKLESSRASWTSGEHRNEGGDEQYEPEMAADDDDFESGNSDLDKTPERLEDTSSEYISQDLAISNETPLFQPPAELGVPADMEVPDTDKQHAIIARTALFLSKQSGQMEIVLKARQSGNPQFAFLEFGNWLNPYYKLVCNAIRSGTYIPDTTKSVPEKSPAQQHIEGERERNSSDSDGEYELHPALKSSQVASSKKSVVVKTEAQSTVNYQTTISQRTVRSAKGKTATTKDVMRAYLSTKYSVGDKTGEGGNEDEREEHGSVNEGPSASRCESHKTDDSYTRSTYDRSAYSFNQDEKSWNAWVQEAAKAYGCDPIQYQAYLASIGCMPPPPPPEEETEKERKKMPTPPPPPGVDDGENLDGEAILSSENKEDEEANDSKWQNSAENSSNTKKQHSDTDEPKEPTIIPPPPDLKLVVDKLAMYVAKNGLEFEQGIKDKNDPRFEFVNTDHVYNPYYKFRKEQYITEVQREEKKEKKTETKSKAPKPVAFSLKKKAPEKPKAKPTVTAVFTAEEDEPEDKEELEGYKPNLLIDGSLVESKREVTERVRIEEPRITKPDRPKETDEEARLMREKQMQMERRRRAAAFIGKLKQQQQQIESVTTDRLRSEEENSESSIESSSRRHFREKRYIPDEDEPDPKRQKATEEMLEKFKAIRDKIINTD